MSAIYQKITLDEIEPGILERITEREVVLWMAARLLQIRNDLPVHNMSVGAIVRRYPPADTHIDIDWTGHTLTNCATCQATSDGMISRLKDELYDKPAERAWEKRYEAKRLIAQAEQLEALVGQASSLSPPNVGQASCLSPQPLNDV